MSGRNRIILVALPLAALAIGFWILLVSPKREEASVVEAEAVELRAQLDEQEQLLAAAEAAREEFPRTYRRLVVLGKAAPQDDDTSSLLVQLERIADKAKVNFAGLESTGGDAAAPQPAAAPQTPADTAEAQEQRTEGAEEGAAPPAPAPATEAHAALLPIGATIGPAGLPVMRYTLDFQGDFFHLADFVAGLDSLVRTQDGGKVGIRGRLVTIDSFELAPTDESSDLTATFTITTYLTPPEQGITAGASPAGPSTDSTASASATPPAPPAASTTPPVSP